MALSRSSRVFLTEAPGGNQALAGAGNRLLIVGFYLLTLGFIVLVMRRPGAITREQPLAQRRLGGPADTPSWASRSLRS